MKMGRQNKLKEYESVKALLTSGLKLKDALSFEKITYQTYHKYRKLEEVENKKVWNRIKKWFGM